MYKSGRWPRVKNMDAGTKACSDGNGAHRVLRHNASLLNSYRNLLLRIIVLPDREHNGLLTRGRVVGHVGVDLELRPRLIESGAGVKNRGGLSTDRQ